jgi:type IV secretion system protein VirB11
VSTSKQYTIPAFVEKLSEIREYLDNDNVTEIVVNRPGELWLGKQGQRYMDYVESPRLTYRVLQSLSQLIAGFVDQDKDKKRKPLLSATIPIDLREGIPNNMRGGYRVQIVEPPAVEEGAIAVVIRKPTLLELNLDMYEEQGAFDTVNMEEAQDADANAQLRELYKDGKWKEFLRVAVCSHKTIMVSAGTNAGKTTLLNALLRHIPPEERIVTMEDSREVKPPHRNALNLLYPRGGREDTDVTPVDLLEAMLRLTPDRAIAGELRGGEAFMFLELINSGHAGSISTIHADSPKLMFERLAQMVMRSGSQSFTKPEITEYARSLIDVVIQFKHGNNGKRYISEILYDHKK